MKHDIAERGVFTRPGMTPVESVESTNLYDVFTYAMVEKMRNDEKIKNMK